MNTTQTGQIRAWQKELYRVRINIQQSDREKVKNWKRIRGRQFSARQDLGLLFCNTQSIVVGSDYALCRGLTGWYEMLFEKLKCAGHRLTDVVSVGDSLPRKMRSWSKQFSPPEANAGCSKSATVKRSTWPSHVEALLLLYPAKKTSRESKCDWRGDGREGRSSKTSVKGSTLPLRSKRRNKSPTCNFTLSTSEAIAWKSERTSERTEQWSALSSPIAVVLFFYILQDRPCSNLFSVHEQWKAESGSEDGNWCVPSSWNRLCARVSATAH
jgi:hypothetical protein